MQAVRQLSVFYGLLNRRPNSAREEELLSYLWSRICSVKILLFQTNQNKVYCQRLAPGQALLPKFKGVLEKNVRL